MSGASAGRSNWRAVAIIGGLVLLVLVVAFAYLAFTAGNFVSDKLNAATDMIASRSGVSPYLVKGAGLILTIPLFYSFAKIAKDWKGLLMLAAPSDPLNMYRSRYGAVVVAYTGVFWILMWWASRDAYAYRFCAEMPDGTVVSSDHPGKEPRYGTPYHPCTVGETNVALDADGKLKAPTEIVVGAHRRVQWFNAATGKPRVWYTQREDGYHFFDHAGNDPESGQTLQPVTARVVNAYEATRHDSEQQAMSARQRQQAEAQEQRQASEDTAAETQAQGLFDNHNYKGALQSCERVLSHHASEVCLQVKHDASIQLAHTLVDQGQIELQRAQFDQAIRSASQAKQLDPDNKPAQNLWEVANVMKQKASVN